MVNWKVRFRSAPFWASMIPLILMTAQNMADVFGYKLDLGDKSDEVMAALTPMMTALIGMGIVVDPTTQGLGDSAQVLAYTEPRVTTPVQTYQQVVQPVAQPVTQVVQQPVAQQPIVQPVTQPVTQPVAQQAYQPVTQEYADCSTCKNYIGCDDCEKFAEVN